MVERKTKSKATQLAAWALALAAVAVGVVAPRDAEARSAKKARTLHVEVNETGGDQVSISVPIGFAKAALTIAGQVDMEMENEDVSVEEIREAWTSLRESGEAAIVDVKDGKDTVRITNERGMVLVDVTEGGERASKVKITIPEEAVDALLSGSGNKLDLGAALGALQNTHTGDIVNIEDGSDRVRIWID